MLLDEETVSVSILPGHMLLILVYVEPSRLTAGMERYLSNERTSVAAAMGGTE